ncbi:MAG: hypothetical protein ABTD50_18265 [Polyangiaceae bacterium]|jgi:hypothetical protein
MRSLRKLARSLRSDGVLRGCFGSALLVFGLSCSLATNADRFEDGVCPAGTKACNDSCVSQNEPAYGCSLPGCAACDLPNAVAGCTPEGSCYIANCATGYQDCDGTITDGCEIDIQHDALNCGQCGCRCGTGEATDCTSAQVVSPIANGTSGCSRGECTVGSCDPGWGDCDGNPANGCETNTTTNSSCGLCGVVCAASAACACTLLDGSTGCSCEAADGATD